MLKIHTQDGRTARIALDDPEQAARWFRLLRDPAYQEAITALTLVHMGVQYSLPRPKGFPSVFFAAEQVAPDPERRVKGGERVVCTAGDSQITLMVHREQRAARVTLFRSGHQRYNPILNGGT